VAVGGNLVDDRAGDLEAIRQPGAAFGNRRRRLRHSLRADHQQDGQARQRGKRSGGPGAARPAVIKAHHAFDDDQVRISRLARQPCQQRFGRHSPWIEVDRRRPTRRFEESRVDVIRAAFGGAHPQPSRRMAAISPSEIVVFPE
jgi:hypothetical protein